MTYKKKPVLPFNQLVNNLSSQAAAMTTNGVPNDVLGNLDPLALLILIPLCDQIVRIFVFLELPFTHNIFDRYTLP